ncbi:MAG: carbohydrate ABC transporter permease [Treponema sp.]|jgi:raffinose/stachyose/melibiose transport system permease protein|nr:carbohydrate ABC transporter permease [Treponema sp.]
MKIKISAARMVIYTILILWAVISLFPLYWMITFSLKSNSEIFGGNPIGLPREWLFSNYASAFGSGNLGGYFLNSVIVSTVTILLTVFVSAMSSYAMMRMQWKLSKAAMSMLMLGLMVPIHAALLPVFVMMRNMRLINTLWSLIVPYTGFAVPMGIMIISGFITSVPKELEEAAFIDGCNIYQMFFTIILPLLKSALATVSIFTFLQSWNELMFAVVFISRESARTLTVGIQSMSGRYFTEWGPIGAALTVATVPTLIIYLALSGQVQKSFIAGAVKG